MMPINHSKEISRQKHSCVCLVFFLSRMFYSEILVALNPHRHAYHQTGVTVAMLLCTFCNSILLNVVKSNYNMLFVCWNKPFSFTLGY